LFFRCNKLFFGAFAFNKVKLMNADFPEGSRNSADLHLSDRGPVVSLNVMDNSAIGDGYEPGYSLRIEPDANTDFALGTRMIYAISPEFAGFALETWLSEPGTLESGHYSALEGSRLHHAVFDGEPLPFFFAVRSELSSQVKCACGAMATYAFADVGAGRCTKCDQSPEMEVH
jgi:hypothetical protein